MLAKIKALMLVHSLLGLILIGCGKEESNSKLEVFTFINKDSGVLNHKIQNEELGHLPLQANTRLQAGSLLSNYRDPLVFNLKGQFISDDSKLVLNAYTTSLTTSDGTRLEFSPNSNGGIEVNLYTKDYPLYHFCTIDHALSRHGLVDISVQLSSPSGVGPSILVWNHYHDPKNKKKKNYNFLSSKNADCNTLDEIFIEHFGSGRLWGFEIKQARIYEVKRIESYGL